MASQCPAAAEMNSTHLHIFIIGLLDTWQATVLKGNAGELAAIANSLEVPMLTAVVFSVTLTDVCRIQFQGPIEGCGQRG